MTGRRVLVALTATVVAGVTAVSAYAAFSAAAANSGNSFAAGTVFVTDNDLGVAMLALTSANPGGTDTSCIRVSYDGSLPSKLTLYGSLSGALLPYLTLTVTRGSGATAFDNCTGFVADVTDHRGLGAGVLYSGALSGFPTTFATGLTDPSSGSPETWTTGVAHWYRFSVSLGSSTAGQGLAGSAAFTWEARNV